MMDGMLTGNFAKNDRVKYSLERVKCSLVRTKYSPERVMFSPERAKYSLTMILAFKRIGIALLLLLATITTTS